MYNEPNNLPRSLLLKAGIVIYRLGLAKHVLALSKNRVRALLYHAVESHESSYTQRLGVSVSPAMFDANLAYFAKYYNVVSVSQLGKKDLPPNPLVITFDDGYKSVHENAFPLLKKHRLPACIYLISRAVDNNLVWVNELNWALLEHREEALQVCHEFPDLLGLQSRDQIISVVQNQFGPKDIKHLSKRLRANIAFEEQHNLYASRDDIKEMSEDDISFGFHTRDHFNLRNCAGGDLTEQLDSSSIDELLDQTSFAYPFGYFSTEAVQGVCNSGYQRIMTVGNNNNRYSAKHLDRIEVFSADPAVVFAKIEIVEPTIGMLRGWIMNFRNTRTRLQKRYSL